MKKRFGPKEARRSPIFIFTTLSMPSILALEERENFSRRLKDALVNAGVSVAPNEFTRAYNARADGAAISIHAARKWLSGEAIPTHEKIVVLATWLGVVAAWLRFGDETMEISGHDVIPEAEISSPMLALMNDIQSLPHREQQMVREMVDAFLRHYVESEKNVGQRRKWTDPPG